MGRPDRDVLTAGITWVSAPAASMRRRIHCCSLARAATKALVGIAAEEPQGKEQVRLGSFDDLMSELSPGTASAVAPIARKLREIILDDFPEAVEVVRLGDGAASYGTGPAVH
jgi:hypothetical protein